MGMIVNSYGFGGAAGSWLFDGVDDSFQMTLASSFNSWPVTISVWVNPVVFANARGTAAIGTSTNVSFGPVVSVTPNAVAEYRNAGVTRTTTAQSDAGLVVGSWSHFVGRMASATSRQLSINGNHGGVNATSATATTSTLVRIGSRNVLGSEGYFNSRIAHVAVWDTVLTDAQVVSLAGGANPQSVENANLRFYAPLTAATATDLVSGSSLSTIGGPTFGATSGPTITPYP